MSLAHERLSEEMRQRGVKLGKRWVQIARDAGITTSALGAIRRGEYRPSSHTAAALDEALGWATGSVEAILDGGEPTPLPPSVRVSQVRLEVPAPPPLPVPTDDELRASGLAPETVEALLDMRRHVERLVAKRDENAIRRANRVLRALDEGQDAG